jgi:tripartite-type tricarboxylate transporter receptor subunit TctC
VPAKSVEELIALAKRSPGKLNYASSASTTFLATELFKSMAGIDMTQVPYKGAGPAVPALIGGEVQVSITSIITMLPHVQSGRARALAVTGQRRSALAPDVPTVNEKAVPGYIASTWYGIFAPAGTPPAIVRYLNTTLHAVMEDPKVRTQLEGQGVDITPNSPEAFKEFVRKDQEKWAAVVKSSGAATPK